MALINIGPRDFEAILAVARTGSFSAAAAQLGLSQPAVSIRIRHAEEMLGVKLFNRTTRRVTPTEHGERLARRAEQTISELRALAHEFKEESRLQRGHVVVGATPAIAGLLLPSIIQRFGKRCPGVEVVLRDAFLEDGLEKVHNGDFDFIVTPVIGDDPRFECEPMMQEEFLLIAPRGHRLVRGGSARLADVAAHPLLTMPAGTRTRELLANACRAAGLSFHIAFETRQMLSLVAMVKAGLGIAFLSENVLPLVNMDGLRTARLEDVSLTRTIAIVRARGKAVQPATGMLIDTVRESMRNA